MGKGEETRQAVLEQAVSTAGRLGLSGLTIGNLATSMKMSKSGLFGHFRSKEALQLQVLAFARDSFTELVIHPAIAAPRGIPRLTTLFECWMETGRSAAAGCVFVAAATEYDDQEGPVRDQLVRDHRDLLESIALMFRSGVSEGHFREDADPEQFAHDLYGVMLGFYHAYRMMRDPLAETRTRRSFGNLVDQAR
ncbi:TetR/AcrR family transcriptional regulator [Longispora albida]|uniref:TetR/AcrR family transcriptional regulator n=1 Tax=Longispora albida TaxID=203523 RepID=UPI00036B1281|nr:TetR/AcrR family transcriptional regulator [Longispora albida]